MVNLGWNLKRRYSCAITTTLFSNSYNVKTVTKSKDYNLALTGVEELEGYILTLELWALEYIIVK